MRDFRPTLVLLLVAALASPATASYIGTKAPAEIIRSRPSEELPKWWSHAFNSERELRYDGDADPERIMAWTLIYMMLKESEPSTADDPEGWLQRARTSADPQEALTWYRKAADFGLPEAQAGLAALHLSGATSRRDLVRAQMWLIVVASIVVRDRAKSDLHFYVDSLRDLLAERLSPEQLAEAERLARDWKPANR